MKGKWFKAVSLVLSSVLTLSLLVGCGGNTSSKSADSTKEVTKAEQSTQAQVEESTKAADPYATLDDSNITILYHTSKQQFDENVAKDPKFSDPVWSNIAAFETKYGGKITVKAVPWGDMKPKLIAMVNAGEQCDIAQANDQNFPIYPVKKLVQPIDQYIDVNDPLWFGSVTKAFTFGGKAYAVGVDATPIVLYYNKTLFNNNGEKTPTEYYNEGAWNWDNFKKVAMDLTKDTNGDGKIDQNGFGWWDGDYNLFLATNGLTNLAYNEDGTIGTNYQKDTAVKAIEFIQNAYIKDKYIDKSKKGDYFINEFKTGKLAMTCEYGFGGFNVFKSDNEIDFVPFPTGPDGQKDTGLGGLSGWSIPTSSKNPKGAAAFIYIMSKALLEANTKTNVERFGQEKVDLINKLAQNMLFVPIGIEKYWDANGTIVTGLRNGTPVGTFLTKANDQITEGVKITLKQ